MIRHNSPMTPLLSGDCEGSDRRIRAKPVELAKSCETSYTADFLIKELPPPTPDRYERRLFPPEHFWKTRSPAVMRPLQRSHNQATRLIYV